MFFDDNAGNYPTLTDGDYYLKLDNVEITESKKGSPMIKLSFIEEKENVKLFDFLVFQDNTKGIYSAKLKQISQQVYEACKKQNANAMDFQDVAQGTFTVLSKLHNRYIKTYVEESYYNDQKSNKVGKYLELLEQGKQPLPNMAPSFDKDEPLPF